MEKEPSAGGYNWATLLLEDINMRTWAPGWGSLESETVKCDHESCRTRTWEWMGWRRPASIVNDKPILSWERILHKDYDRKCSIENINSGRESQGAWSQDELIGGKPSVVKWLWLWLWRQWVDGAIVSSSAMEGQNAYKGVNSNARSMSDY
jgi:hypothetical protein